ncbi:MAG: SRPBCC domain-containing protein [Pseudomonadota bacterium]
MDPIFKALNDSQRRHLLDQLRLKDGQTLSELEAHCPDLSRFGVMKHLKVLEDAGLITTRRAGRFKHHHLNAAPLQEVIDRWIEPLLAKPAAQGLLAFKAALENAPMSPDLVLSTYINTTRDALWDAITRADHIMAHHFASQDVRGDQVPGETVAYYFENGEKMLETTTIASDPKSRLEVAFQPLWEPEAKPSRYVYLLEEDGDAMRLTVEHYDLPADQKSDVSDGWARELASLKTWLETGSTPRFTPSMDEHY